MAASAQLVGLATSMRVTARVCRGLPGRRRALVQPEPRPAAGAVPRFRCGQTGEGCGERLRQWKLLRSVGVRGSRAGIVSFLGGKSCCAC